MIAVEESGDHGRLVAVIVGWGEGLERTCPVGVVRRES